MPETEPVVLVVEQDFRVELLKDMADQWNRLWFNAAKSPRRR